MSDLPANAFYTGLVADLYTPLKSTRFAAAPYRDLIHRFGEPALELGCGDGDPLLDLRAMALDVDGIDSSPDMIERLRRRALEQQLDVTAWVASMEAMKTTRAYRTIFLAGPTFNLLPDDDTMQQALVAIGRALAAQGAAVIPLFEPEPVHDADLGVSKRQELQSSSISCEIVTAERDPRRRTQTLALRYERVGEQCEVLERDWLIHWVGLNRFTEMADRAGLRVTSAPDSIGHEPQDVVLEPR